VAPGASSRFESLLLLGVWLVCAVALLALCLQRPALSPYLTVAGVLVTCGFAVRLRRRPLGPALRLLLPRTWLEAALGLGLIVVLVVAVARVPALVRSASTSLQHGRLPLAQADIEPLAPAGGSVPEIAAAAKAIPPDATYSVVGGDKYRIWAVVRFWLAPRTFVVDYTHAPWVVVYGPPVPRDLPAGKRVPIGQGGYVLEVGR
jgi:hypothetical protein